MWWNLLNLGWGEWWSSAPSRNFNTAVGALKKLISHILERKDEWGDL